MLVENFSKKNKVNLVIKKSVVLEKLRYLKENIFISYGFEESMLIFFEN